MSLSFSAIYNSIAFRFNCEAVKVSGAYVL
jgi:hypothetical protein